MQAKPVHLIQDDSTMQVREVIKVAAGCTVVDLECPECGANAPLVLKTSATERADAHTDILEDGLFDM